MLFILSLFVAKEDSSIIQILPALIILQIANWLQGPRFKAFIESGGSKHSHWRVAGIGLLCLAVVGAVYFVVILSLPAFA
jgi:hypothetical protein